MTADDKKRAARLRLRARRQRDGDLRRRALFLSLIVFGVLWLAIFAQLVTGHDPVLGMGTKVALVRKEHARKRARPATHSSSAQADEAGGAQVAPEQTQSTEPAPSATETTPTQSVPVAPAQSAPAPAQTAPAPVVTSQS